MIPLRDKHTNIAAEVRKGKEFERFVQKTAADIAERVGDNEGLNEEVAAAGRRFRLNRLQLQRLIEEVNTLSFNVRYKMVKNQRDRRLEFELAKMDTVLNMMGNDAPPEIQNPNFPNGFIEPPRAGFTPLDKVASYEKLTFKGKPDDLIKAERHNLERKAKRCDYEYKESISKIAHVLINSDCRNHNGTELYSTLLGAVDGTEKLATDIENALPKMTGILKKAGRIPQHYVPHITYDADAKQAEQLFGSASLIKSASGLVKDPEVFPTDNIFTYTDLVKVASHAKKNYNEIKEIMEVLHQ